MGLESDLAGLMRQLSRASIVWAGKIIGAAVPAVLMTGWVGAILLGVSLVPRAEIALIIMQRGLSLGNWAVSPEVFAAMVAVSAVTSIATPLILHRMLEQWPQTQPEES